MLQTAEGNDPNASLWQGLISGGDVTDVHINAASPDSTVMYPGPRRMPEAARPAVVALLEACKRVQKDDFMVESAGRFWRGRRDSHAVDGVWYRCRLSPMAAPTLQTLPTPLPDMVVQMLLTKSLTKGGLIYVVGATGQGKTTTASGIVTSRLIQYGGCAYTVEDPPEMPLSGWHGDGYCSQAWVPGDHSSDWSGALRGALRSQPSNTPSMLYVGEVRDEDSARTMLRAAGNGFLVIATGFGNDIPSGLEALAMLAGNEALPVLASNLRIVVHTRLVASRLVVNTLASQGGSSAVAMAIERASFRQIVGEVNLQANFMREGQNPLLRVE